MKIAVIKYNAGNIYSLCNALTRLGVEGTVTDEEDTIRSADKVIFPGVGEASSAMAYLRNVGLDRVLASLTQPLLGICLGLQLMCRYSEENDTECLGIFDESVKKFPPEDKVPHIGWNDLISLDSPLFDGLSIGDYVYFVHGYYAATGTHTVAKADYILPFSAALQKDNFYAVQFHPEKSGKVGAQILKNFLNI